MLLVLLKQTAAEACTRVDSEMRCNKAYFAVNRHLGTDLIDFCRQRHCRHPGNLAQTCSFSKLPLLTIYMQPIGCVSSTCS
jgi:hypothetical protein